MAIITWNNAPDYDEWGFDSHWSCSDWITWHKKLTEHFGEKTATEIWNYAFQKSTELSSNLGCNAIDSDFRSYVRSHNLKVNTDIITETIGLSSDVLTGTVSTTSNVFEGSLEVVNSLFKGGNFKKTLSVVAVVAGIVGVAYVYKSFKK